MTAPPDLPIVLLVEDNADLREILLVALQPLGPFRMVGAANGLEGLEQCLELRPQCVVLDVMMPEINGYQLVRALRGDPETAATPVIILSALAEEQDQFAGLAAGVDHYVIKPVMPQDLVATIRTAIALSEAERLQRWQALLEAAPPAAE